MDNLKKAMKICHSLKKNQCIVLKNVWYSFAFRSFVIVPYDNYEHITDKEMLKVMEENTFTVYENGKPRTWWGKSGTARFIADKKYEVKENK